MDKNRVILTVINDLIGDQRVRRVASSLSEAGYEVLVVGRRLPDSQELPERQYRMKRMKLWFRRGKLFYLEMNVRLFFFLLFQGVDILHANDLDTLLPNFLISRLRSKALVYDSHEYFTEVPELISRPRTRAVWLWLEKRLFPRLRYVFTVNQALADKYQERYGIPVHALRNLPLQRNLPTGHTARKPFTLIYQGALNIGRGIERMIDAMEHLTACELWIAGQGDVAETLQRRAREKGLQDRIRFLGLVPMDELCTFTRQASLGLSLEENLGDNYRLSSPNKVFDYVQDGVPVLVSDLPVMKNFVEENACGWVLPETEREPQKLAAFIIDHILSEDGNYQEKRANCLALATRLNWEAEQKILLKSYREISERK